MVPSLAVILTAIHSLAPPTSPPTQHSGLPDSSVPPAVTLVIARPEASDFFLTSKTRTTASAILVHNPELIRARSDEAPYRLDRATALGWKTFRRSDLPGARAYNALHATVIPEPATPAHRTHAARHLQRRRRPPRAD
jgi:hypothetical protein